MKWSRALHRHRYRPHRSNRPWRTALLFFLILQGPPMLTMGKGLPCGYPGKPRNGTSSTKSAASMPGETAQYFCLPGFTMFGDQERICEEDGNWGGKLPVCELNLVLGRPTEMSGQMFNYRSELANDGSWQTCAVTFRSSEQRWWQVELEKEYVIGSISLVAIADPGRIEGYIQRENEIAKILPMSPWELQEINSYHEVTVFVVDLISKREALYRRCIQYRGKFYDTRMFFPCEDGGLKGRYVYVRDDRREIGFWGICEVEVFAHRGSYACGDPERPVGGIVTVIDTTANYSCEAGHEMSGAASRDCQYGGVWSGIPPTCTPADCGQPPVVDHASMELANDSTTLYNLAMYTCETGYISLSGSTQWFVMCMEDGQWEEQNATCVVDQDNQLPVKVRESIWKRLASLPAFVTPFTVLAMLAASSIILTVFIVAVFINIRNYRLRKAYRASKSSTNELLRFPQRAGTSSPAAAEPVEHIELTEPIQTEVIVDVHEEPEPEPPRTSIRRPRPQMTTVTEEIETSLTHRRATRLERDLNESVPPEILTLYAQIDLSAQGRRPLCDISKPCRVSKNCDCAKYRVSAAAAAASASATATASTSRNGAVNLPMKCLLPPSRRQYYDPMEVMQTFTSERL